METSALHSQISVFIQEDDWMYFVLGMAYAVDQLRRSLESQPELATQAAALLPQESEEVLFFILGLLSFSKNTLAALDRFQAGSPDPASAAPLPAEEAPSMVIRQLLR
jgi:hypothetical protein